MRKTILLLSLMALFLTGCFEQKPKEEVEPVEYLELTNHADYKFFHGVWRVEEHREGQVHTITLAPNSGSTYEVNGRVYRTSAWAVFHRYNPETQKYAWHSFVLYCTSGVPVIAPGACELRYYEQPRFTRADKTQFKIKSRFSSREETWTKLR